MAPIPIHRNLSVLSDAAEYDASWLPPGAARNWQSGWGLASTEGMAVCHPFRPMVGPTCAQVLRRSGRPIR